MRDLCIELAQLFYGAFEFLVADTPRRNWTRPRNQKVRPLVLDRRSRIFHCRNAI